MTPVVELAGLRKTYNPGTPVAFEVLHGIDLAIRPGEFACLIGPSGSGKSTLLNMIGLLEPPTAGRYLLKGRAIQEAGDDDRTRARLDTLGFVFQFHHLLPEFTAEENVMRPLLIGRSADPQVAWAGLTEEQAGKQNRPVRIERFPWKFSNRAITMGVPGGLTKIIADTETGRALGVGISGRNTEGLISEGVLAIEMGALVQDMALSIHPHPTRSETVGEAAEIFLGSVTHLLPKKDR